MINDTAKKNFDPAIADNLKAVMADHKQKLAEARNDPALENRYDQLDEEEGLVNDIENAGIRPMLKNFPDIDPQPDKKTRAKQMETANVRSISADW